MSADRVVRIASLFIIIAAAGGFVALLIAGAGYDVSAAVRAAVDGAFGGSFPVLSATLKRATPLLLLGIAVAVAFRAGVLNIGADGQFMAGATAAAAVGLYLPVDSAPLLLAAEFLAALLAGASWGGLAAWLRSRFGVTEVVSTLLLNFVAINVVGYLVRGPMQEPTHSYPQSALLPEAARLPPLISDQRLHWGFVIALLVAIGAWWALRNTAAGFRLRVVGSNPAAAHSAGLIAVERVRGAALMVSGAIAGIAGFSETGGVTYALYEGLSAGQGYVGIGVALLAGLRPLPIIGSAIFFGALAAGGDAMQREAGIPAEFAAVVAATVLLGALAVPAVHRVMVLGFRTGKQA